MNIQKLLIAGSLLFSSITIQAQNLKIHGAILHPLSDSIYFSCNTDRIRYDPQQYGAKLDEKGNFDIKVPVVENYTQIDILHGNQASEIFIDKNADLTLSLDAADFDKTLHFEGKGSASANFSVKHVLEIGMKDNYSSAVRPLYLMSPDSFVTELGKLKQKELDFLAANKSGLSSGFIEYWSKTFEYDNYYCMLLYPTFHAMMTKKSNNVSLKDYAPASFAVTDKVPAAFNDAYLDISEYRMYADNYFAMKLIARGVDMDDPSFTDSILNHLYKDLKGKTAEYAIATIIYRQSKNFSTEKWTAEYNKFRKTYPKSEYGNLLENANLVKTKMGIGKPAIDFDVTTRDGKTVKLSNLKGKTVYVDFWASWCAPCISQLGDIKKIEEHFKDNDKVVFLYISIDEDKKMWEKAINTYKIDGTHVLDGGSWNGKVARLYSIERVPTSFIVDKNGNFATDQFSVAQYGADAIVKKLESIQ